MSEEFIYEIDLCKKMSIFTSLFKQNFYIQNFKYL